MKIALIVGHNKEGEGAYSPFMSMTEYQYNNLLADSLNEMFPDTYRIFIREPNKSYKKQMDKVIGEVHDAGEFDLVVELHFNSYSDPKAHGSMGLYYARNKKTKRIIEDMQKRLKNIYGITPRENIPVSLANMNSVNGGYGIMQCKYPYILTEPFFGSNEKESNIAMSYKQLANVLHKSFSLIRG